MINTRQFRELVVRPALKEVDMWSQAAENLMIGTALIESELTHLSQVPSGPGKGLYQIEPTTYYELIKYLHRRLDLATSILEACAYTHFPATTDALISNLKYATLMARVRYWWSPDPLPEHNDIENLGNYHKKHYNTSEGASDPQRFIELYKKYGDINV